MTASIVTLLGSPRRNGNSATLAHHIGQGAIQAGAQVETVYTHGLTVSPCRACYACQKPGVQGCAIDDDMTGLYKKLLAADGWIVATPIYFYTMSAQTKLWIDRCFALTAENAATIAGKRVAVALTYDEPDLASSGGDLTLKTFEAIFRYLKMDFVGTASGRAQMLGAIGQQVDLCRQAESLGRQLADAES